MHASAHKCTSYRWRVFPYIGFDSKLCSPFVNSSPVVMFRGHRKAAKLAGRIFRTFFVPSRALNSQVLDFMAPYGITRRYAPRPFGAAGKASGVQIDRTVDLSNPCGAGAREFLPRRAIKAKSR
jgi:hypothetical protein